METKDLLDLQLMMFLLMGVGVLLRKINLITKEGKAVLTDLVIDVILPCNIITAFSIEFSKEYLISGAEILLVSLVLQCFCSLVSAFCYRKVPKRQRMVLQYGTVCSNAGLLGNAVAGALYGATGLLYASIYLIPQRIVMWSAGVSYFTESPSRKEVVKKVLKHPCIIAVEIGIVIMAFRISLPTFLYKGISNLSGCTTAVSMLLIGAILADAGLKGMVSKITVLYTVIRLILIPSAVLLGCLLFHVEETAAGLSVILAAMPAGSTTAILAAKYQGDEVFASRCVVLSTLLSMALLPVWCLLLNAVL